MKRMNRDEFFGKLATLNEERLKKALWNLYWRGSAPMRERIESEIDPIQRESRKRRVNAPVDPQSVLSEVRDFVELARSGAYLGGDRRVSPKERSRWRFTFQRLAGDAQRALGAEDVAAAAPALEQLIDLACEMQDREYFRSDDPVEAARFVVSDAVALLWRTLRETYGFGGFAERAAPQLVRWESRYGWTRSGWGPLSEKETSLATVLVRMLPATDMWLSFADHYLNALDQVSRAGVLKPRHGSRAGDFERDQRTKALAEWHLLLLERLADDDSGDHIVRLTEHPALGGPELTFLRARLAHHRGDLSRARELAHECLQVLPGHGDFLEFATEIGAPIPERAREIGASRV